MLLTRIGMQALGTLFFWVFVLLVSLPISWIWGGHVANVFFAVVFLVALVVVLAAFCVLPPPTPLSETSIFFQTIHRILHGVWRMLMFVAGTYFAILIALDTRLQGEPDHVQINAFNESLLETAVQMAGLAAGVCGLFFVMSAWLQLARTPRHERVKTYERELTRLNRIPGQQLPVATLVKVWDLGTLGPHSCFICYFAVPAIILIQPSFTQVMGQLMI